MSAPRPPEVIVEADAPAPGHFGATDVMCRIFVRGIAWFETSNEDVSGVVMQNVDVYTALPEDRLRAAMMAGAFEDSEAALARLTELRDSLIADQQETDPDGGPFAEDPAAGLVLDEITALETVYRDGPDALDAAMRDQFIVRYGVLGRVAVTHGKPNTDPSRAPAVTGFVPIMLVFVAVGVLAVVAPLVGLVLLVVGLARMSDPRSGPARFTPPTPGGSVFLEVFALFVLGFLIMSIGTTLLALYVDPLWGIVSIPLQWALLLAPLWPLARSMPAGDWRRAIGLHGGTGVAREIGYGLLAYIATVPLYYAAVLVTLVLLIISGALSVGSGGGEPQAPVSNPIIDLVAGADPITLVLVFTLATVWAPLAEELVFRGALQRHLRARMPFAAAGLITAVIFAFMHSYGPLLVTPLITLGFAFSFVRERRGSLIAPMTMHFVHNATLISIMIVVVSLLKDPA